LLNSLLVIPGNEPYFDLLYVFCISEMTIEKLRSDDLQGLKELYDEGFEGSSGDFDQMKRTFELIRNNSVYHIRVARKEGKIVGSVMGIICNELFGKCLPFMVIENVVVLKSYRRLGIAKKLMIDLEPIAKDNRCTTILFVSSAHRIGAHVLYESLGYGMDKVNGYRKRLVVE
jgi:GNAT superfamily N-acetyltransferase